MKSKSPKKTKLMLDGRSLTLEDVFAVAHDETLSIEVALTKRSQERIQKSRNFILSKLKGDEPIYGVNTGFGLLSQVKIEPKKLNRLQVNLIRSHCVGVGLPLPIHEVRAAILLRINTLAGGYSGVSLEVVEALLGLLNAGVHPYIPEQGSVGASGDLAPLAHMALTLIGEGRAFYQGQCVDSALALKKAKLKPYHLQAKEGLSLINGTQIMTAIGSLLYMKAKRLCELSDMSAAMSVEALRGTVAAYDIDISKVRPHRGQLEVSQRMTRLLSQSEIMESHKDCGKVQDPYSLRCVPQVHGVVRDALRQIKKVLEVEINSVTDNPIVFSDKKKIVSGGNFHGEYVAMAMDQLAIAVSEIASISEQRMEKLINPAMSGLPAFLIENGGLNSGFMIVQVAAASLVSENKILSHPAVVDSIPTSADKEDHVSMGATAAVKARKVVQNSWNVIAMEFLCASQGLDFHKPLRPARLVERAYNSIRKVVPPIAEDRAFYVDIENISRLMERDLPA